MNYAIHRIQAAKPNSNCSLTLASPQISRKPVMMTPLWHLIVFRRPLPNGILVLQANKNLCNLPFNIFNLFKRVKEGQLFCHGIENPLSICKSAIYKANKCLSIVSISGIVGKQRVTLPFEYGNRY